MDFSANNFSATYKVLVLGDSNVGKTCIVHRYCDERYYDTYISTIGKLFVLYYEFYAPLDFV
jgi:GTPase SAR1 family protein